MATVGKTGGTWITACGALALLIAIPINGYCAQHWWRPKVRSFLDAQYMRYMRAPTTGGARARTRSMALTGSTTPTRPAAPAGQAATMHFGTLPPHAVLPTGAQCAQWVMASPTPENRPQNTQANQSVPTKSELADFWAQPTSGSFAPAGDFKVVDGNFTGTTDEIIRWAACKWGIDEDVARAEAVAETNWRETGQGGSGDLTNTTSLCPSGAFWSGGRCAQSYGLYQIKYRSFPTTFPMSWTDSAFNADFRMAYQRACMNGDIHYLSSDTPMGGYPQYPDNNTDDMLWGCMGDWFYGGWDSPPAVNYEKTVQRILANKPWLKSNF